MRGRTQSLGKERPGLCASRSEAPRDRNSYIESGREPCYGNPGRVSMKGMHPRRILTALGGPLRAPKGFVYMEQHVRLVKSQIAWLQSQIARFTPDHPRYRPEQVALYQRLVIEHRELLALLESLLISHGTASVAFPPLPSPAPTDQRHDDLSDLPEELLSELSGRTAKGESDPLVRIIADRGGTANIDEILIDLFRKHGQIGKRTLIQNKLYRLSKQGSVWPTPGRKGVYTTKAPEGPES
jgi:hypothetical protein